MPKLFKPSPRFSRTPRLRPLLENLESRILMTAAPTGWIDIANSSIVSGWAVDPDEGALPLTIEITINGEVAETTANLYRGDLVAPFGSAYHGFSFTMPSSLPPGETTIAIDALNSSTGERTRLGERTVTNPIPQGWLDIITDSRIAGWVFDADNPTGGSKIRIDIDGILGTPIVASAVRNDLSAVVGTSNVGFDVTGNFASKVIEIYKIDDPSNSAVLLYSNNQNSYGSLDVVNTNYLIGWAFDPDAPEKAVFVRVDVDGVAGTPFAANTTRPDLLAPLGSTDHGWSISLSNLAPGAHTLTVYLIDPEAASAAPILLGTASITNAAPVGYVDSVNSTQLKGWAADPDLGSSPATVRVYVDDFLFTPITASEARPDLIPVVGSPNHGFTVDLSSLTAGSHAITVTVEDDRSSTSDETVIFDGFINNTSPRGWLDLVSNTTIAGWAQDPDVPTEPIDVDVYVDGVYVGSATADSTRNDLTASIGSSNHGFSVDLPPLSFGTHLISVYAAESQGTISTLIGSKTITNNRPTGIVDSVSTSFISGWTADYDMTTLSLDVLVYINGVPATSGIANSTRNDLLPFFGSANHGYVIAMPTLTSGTYQVDVYVLDKNNGLRTNIGTNLLVV